MKFFLSGLGNWYNDFNLVSKAILTADKLDYDGALIPDHYMWGTTEWLKRPDSNVTMESWITITHLLAKTEQIRLGTLVTPIPFRPPGMLAKMVSTLDVLSNGRVIVGIGAGWSQVEFDAFSEWNEPRTRVDKTKEGLELMIQLWTQDEVTFEGKYYRAHGAIVEPKPIQKPYPKLLFGGRGDRMLKLAAKYADICFVPSFQGTDNLEERRQIVINAAKHHNREKDIGFMDGSMRGILSKGSFDTSNVSKLVDNASEAGMEYFLVSISRTESFLENIESFASDVIPSYR
ncbi:MAG: LLM class flavin-dependent oxidoreductase [Candidatus Heimdallarchaeota archaeon]